MKKLFSKGLLFFAFCATFVSCHKETKNRHLHLDENINKSQSAKFSSFEELTERLEKIRLMGEMDRREYENKNSFKSLFTKVYEIYEGFDFSKIDKNSVLTSYVNQNENFLEIITNYRGDKEFRPIYSDNPYSLIAGVNRMIIVGEICMKVFDDGIITAPVKMFETLLILTDKKVEGIKPIQGFEILKIIFEDQNNKSNCGTIAERLSEDGSERTRIRITLVPAYVNTSSGSTWSSNPWYEVRPFKRTLGTWYQCQRTISGAVTSSVEYNQLSGSVITFQFNRTIPPTLSYVQTRETFEPTQVASQQPLNLRFSYINMWGDTPSTPTASLICQ